MDSVKNIIFYWYTLLNLYNSKLSLYEKKNLISVNGGNKNRKVCKQNLIDFVCVHIKQNHKMLTTHLV